MPASLLYAGRGYLDGRSERGGASKALTTCFLAYPPTLRKGSVGAMFKSCFASRQKPSAMPTTECSEAPNQLESSIYTRGTFWARPNLFDSTMAARGLNSYHFKMKMTYANGFFSVYSALKSLALAQARPGQPIRFAVHEPSLAHALISRKISSFTSTTFSI